jgi:hypothetical protein
MTVLQILFQGDKWKFNRSEVDGRTSAAPDSSVATHYSVRARLLIHFDLEDRLLP